MFEIVLLQETWYNITVKTEKLVNMTNYNAYRRGRASTTNKRNIGGGVITLINKKLPSEIIPIEQKTLAEVMVTSSKLNNSSSIIIANVYIPPYHHLKFINELSKIIVKIQKKCIHDQLLVIRDFNLF